MSGTAAKGTHAHQFDSIEQQNEAVTLGMWIFLVTEVMFFGGLFAAYGVYFYWYPEVFEHASLKMNLWLGGFNTVVLLTSSLTMVLAVHACKLGKSRQLTTYLLVTVALACVFLCVKGFEYYEKYDHGLLIGKYFLYDGADAKEMHLFMCLYFFMTGLHGIHVIIGIGLLSFFTWMAWKKKLTPDRFMPIELTGLYWHFVDLIWVFLFPMLYLMGVR